MGVADLARETAHRWARSATAALPAHFFEVVRRAPRFAKEEREELVPPPLERALCEQWYPELLGAVQGHAYA